MVSEGRGLYFPARILLCAGEINVNYFLYLCYFGFSVMDSQT